MKLACHLIYSVFLSVLLVGCISPSKEFEKTVDVLIVGGGASGTTAGIQSARLGANTLIVEEFEWLGGMLTSAGVSAIDGNYQLHSGLWEEFRQQIYKYYGDADSVKTGWVSNVLFEPSVGNKILKKMVAAEPNLKVQYQSFIKELRRDGAFWVAVFHQKDGEDFMVKTKILIDATELGDVAKMAGIPYRIGMDPKSLTGEDIALEEPHDIVQDITYVATLKDYGKNADKTIAKPEGYNPDLFLRTCSGKVENSDKQLYTPQKMLEYGKLPNGKYMINWPIYGNDYYLNIIELSREERNNALKAAKLHTLQYVYYLQTELGFKNLGLADDEFPTVDKLPFMPYHRESRRIEGEVLFTLNHIAKPYGQKQDLYRTGIAVGDYPVDHHHSAYSLGHKFPDLHFYPVPSYALPLGTLIPKGFDNFIVAEKSISVSNIVNGTTRLQPVCLLIGQAAGTLAALAVKESVQPRNVPVRHVQQELLNASAYILPYIDVHPDDAYFTATQKVGAAGILKYFGKSEGWSNKSYFYPDSLVLVSEITSGLKNYNPSFSFYSEDKYLSGDNAILMIQKLLETQSKKLTPEEILKNTNKALISNGLKRIDKNQMLTRAEFAIIIDALIDPFNSKNVDLYGHFLN